MKRVLFRCLAAGMLLVCCMLCCACRHESYEAVYTELGIPSAQRYTTVSTARCPWDMTVWDGKLYIGSGNYDTNMGPVDILYYDIGTGAWVTEGSVPDEEVSRFVELGGKLVAPGIDPRDDWTYGNYYVLEGGEWTTVRTIPNAKHVFDMAEHDGMIFAGIGLDVEAAPDGYPVVCSTDGGASFETVPMVRDGAPLDLTGVSTARVYDLFVLGDELYAAYFGYDGETVTYDLYRYDEGVLVFDNQWYGKVGQIRYIGNIVGAKAQFNGKMYFTTGYLYTSSDMNEFTKITLLQTDTVYDLYVADGVLYALGGALQEDGRYRVSLWRNEGGEQESFEECFYFFYDTPPLSLVCHDDRCYIGMGGILSESDATGMILSIPYRMP